MGLFNHLRRYTFLLSIIYGLSPSYAQLNEVDHWEALIDEGQEWQCFPGTSEPQENWNELGFDASGWLVGSSGIGYGDGDDRTAIDPAVSLYMRRTFNLVDTSLIKALYLYMDYDDAFVAYLNGKEICRANVNGQPPEYNTLASSLHEALMYRGSLPEEFRIDESFGQEIMMPGENVLAVQVHNHDASSSDMTSIPFLMAGIGDTARNYMDTPEWFIPPVDYSVSSLPIISVNTFDRSIPDEPKVKAWMKVIDQGEGQTNSLYDEATGYDGWIGIEIRGESAQMFPKKSYGFETRDSLGENNNVPLLGLPPENDWILYGPYSDKTLIKNVLTYKLTRDLGRYASRTEFCELFINGDYRGLYVLMERIKRDRNRLDIAKLNPEDVSGDQLTGGYILRVDKIDANDYPAWSTLPSSSLRGEDPISFQYFDPDGDELKQEQRDYIRNWMIDFETALNAPYYFDPEIGFKAYTDIPSFIDFLIINELTKNIDAYIFSTYMYKDRDSKEGKLYMGPVWDFNISFGNVDYNDAAMQPYGWLFQAGWRMYWFRRMMNDRIFSNQWNCRWHELRSGILSTDRILGVIDSMVTELEAPIRKNYRRWPVLNTYVWPNIFIGGTYEREIDYLKDWLLDRLEWMDDNIPVDCVTGFENGVMVHHEIAVYPNPFSDRLLISVHNEGKIESVRLVDRQGRLLIQAHHRELIAEGSALAWNDEILQKIPAGIYILSVEMSDGRIQRELIMKR